MEKKVWLNPKRQDV